MNSYYYPNNNYYYPPPDMKNFLDKIRLGLRRHGRTVGICVLVSIIIQYVIGYGLAFSGLYPDYKNNEIFSKSFDIIYSVTAVFVPFFILYLTMSKSSRELVTPVGKPVSGKLMAAGVLAGLMFCMVGSDLTSYLAAFLKSVFGVTISAPSSVPATTFTGKLLYFCSVAVIPPLSEEFALRGVVLQPLRKYGDVFAIVMSALIFALMHGTALQVPFAFIAGLSLGYFTIATGTLWTGILIHCLNNAITVAVGLLAENHSDILPRIYGGLNAVIFVTGIISAMYFLFSKEKIRLKRTSVNLLLGDRVKTFLLNPMMIISFGILLYQTITFVSFGG
ncbi:MAG: CPBP family intramembrane metalloprotease [Clostridiales bacterium]|nr:CPBP family intramembrane metalloprotease [Clostridiales bacterium]